MISQKELEENQVLIDAMRESGLTDMELAALNQAYCQAHPELLDCICIDLLIHHLPIAFLLNLNCPQRVKSGKSEGLVGQDNLSKY